jgi:tetratricopeptide (TPR) repeat protein
MVRLEAVADPLRSPGAPPRSWGLFRSVLDWFLHRDSQSLRFAQVAAQLLRERRLSEAAELCARGISRHPDYATGHVVMGEIYFHQERLEEAERHWARALRLDPRHPQAHFRMGELHFVHGNLSRAITELETAVLLRPNFTEARELLSKARNMPLLGAGELEREQQDHLGAYSVLAALRQCPFVENALLATRDGRLLARSKSSVPDPELNAALAVELGWETGRLLTHLRAGKLRGLLLKGEKGSLRSVSLPDATLIATLGPQAPLGAAEPEIAQALSIAYRTLHREEHSYGLLAAG